MYSKHSSSLGSSSKILASCVLDKLPAFPPGPSDSPLCPCPSPTSYHQHLNSLVFTFSTIKIVSSTLTSCPGPVAVLSGPALLVLCVVTSSPLSSGSLG